MNQTEQSQVFPASVTSSSKQYQAHQFESDDRTQYTLAVERELRRLDSYAAEYAQYKKGQCTVGQDGFVYDSEGLMLSRTVSDIKQPVHSEAIPDGFAMSPWGKLETDYGKPKTILGKPLLPVSVLRTDGEVCIGVRYMYLDQKKQCQHIDLFITRVINDYKAVRTQLYQAGIGCPGAREDGLLSYIEACGQVPGLGLTYLHPQAGFDENAPIYVWPNSSIGKVGFTGHQCELIPDPTAYLPIHAKGTLSEWQENIAAPVKELQTMLFAILVCLSNVFMKLSNTGTMIFHFHGMSSGGKTTHLQVGQSVSGVASDPSAGPATAILKWDATVAGLLAMFQQRTGIGICLDELGSLSSHDPLQFAYSVTGGQSRLRSNINGTCNRNQSSSAVCGLSSGEESFREMLERSKTGTKGGISVRLLDIEVTAEDAGLAGDSLEQTRRRVNGLKAASSQYYGTAMPAFIEALLNMPDVNTPDDLKRIFDSAREECLEWLISRSGLDNPPLIATRGAGCFAFVMATGRLAVELGILPFDAVYVDNAVLTCFRRWLMSMDGIMDDVTREAYRLLDALSEQRRKIHMGKPSMETRELWGFTEEGKLYIEMAQLHKLLTSKPRLVTKWLLNNGYIVHYADKRYVKEIVIDGLPGNYYVFSVDKVFRFRGYLFDDLAEVCAQSCENEASTVPESSTPSFTRSATSETGSVIAASSQCIPELSEEEIEQF